MLDGTGHEACMLALLEAGGIDSIDAADAQGWTPLQLAAIEGHEPCVCTLLMAGSALPSIFPYDEEGSYEPAVDAIQGAAEWLGLLSDTPDDEGSDAEGGSAGSSGGTDSSEGADSDSEPDVPPGAALDDALHSELCCPITNDVMQDPVIAADGTTYERHAIEGKWRDGRCFVGPASSWKRAVLCCCATADGRGRSVVGSPGHPPVYMAGGNMRLFDRQG